MKIELTEYELFLIEMALDQTLYSISDIESPLYKRFEEIDVRISKTRSSIALDLTHPTLICPTVTTGSGVLIKQEEKDILKGHQYENENSMH